MKKLITTLAVLLAFATPARAQLGSVPYTFSSGTVISSSQMNTLMSTIFSSAVNRAAGVMTGTLTLSGTAANIILGSNYVSGDGDDEGISIDSSGVVTISSLSLTTLTCTGCVGATQIAATAVTAASYGGANSIATFTVDADGRLTAAAGVTPQIPIATGVTGLGTGVATWLATPSSTNLATAVTDETGSGPLVFSVSPTLTTPNLGTPTAINLTNATSLPDSALSSNVALLADAEAVTGAWTFSAGVTQTSTSSSPATGKLHFNSTDGITQSGRTGSTSDLAWYNAAGAKAAYLRAGTGRWVFGTNSPNNHAGVVIEGVDSDAFFGTVSTSTDPAREGGTLSFLRMADGLYYKSAVWAATVADDTVATGYMCANTHASYMNAGVQQDDVFILGCGNKGVVFWPSGSTTGYAALMPGLRTMHIRGTVMQGDAEIGLMPDVGDYRVPNGWDMYARNAADTDNYQVLAFSVGDVLEVGDNDTVTLLGGSRLAIAGTSSAYPAFKRSGTTVQVRLADDSGYGSIDASSLLLSGTSIFATANSWTAAQTISAPSNILTLQATTNGNNFTRVQNAAGTTKWQFYLSGGGEDWTMYSSGADVGIALLVEAGTRDVYIPGGNLYVTGTQTIGGGSSISSSSDLARIGSANTWTASGNAFTADLKIAGAEGGAATLRLWADEGDDNADKYSIVVGASSVGGSGLLQFYAYNGSDQLIMELGQGTLFIPWMASTTGTNYICSNDQGFLDNSATACSGTDAALIASIPTLQQEVAALRAELAALRPSRQ